MDPRVLSEESRSSVQNHSWKTSREKVGKLGSAIVSIPDASEASTSAPTASTSVNPIYCFHRHIHWWIYQILETLKAPFALRQSKQAQSLYTATIRSLKSHCLLCRSNRPSKRPLIIPCYKQGSIPYFHAVRAKAMHKRGHCAACP